MMRCFFFGFALALASAPAAEALAQQVPFERLPAEAFDVRPPSDWVRGVPGAMAVNSLECRSVPMHEVRRRIVDVAVQEWAFFGFSVLDRAEDIRLLPPGAMRDPDRLSFESANGRAPLLNGQEARRLASSIGGYWAVTPDGWWIVEQQNGVWNGRGIGARWRQPWSAAFISWVMCEAGLGSPDRFQRSIAHHAYIDQAIRARDGQAPGAAFEAYELGEAEVEPGDLLCDARRPAYLSLAERRRQMGMGAGTHCDIVVEVDEANEQILAVGGNVLRSVSLKVFQAVQTSDGMLRPLVPSGRPLFAHLKLRADPVELDALARTPTFQAASCSDPAPPSPRMLFVSATLGVAAPSAGLC